MGTGVNHDLGKLYEWNYNNRTTFFEGKCADIDGSASEFYLPNQKRDSLSFFSADICRTIKLDYDEDVVVNGIKGYKFSAQDSFLDNGEW